LANSFSRIAARTGRQAANTTTSARIDATRGTTHHADIALSSYSCKKEWFLQGRMEGIP
jgi:hypothetical protein